MKLREKFEIEPLGDARRLRIERELFDRLTRGEGAPRRAQAERAHGLRWRSASALVLAGATAAIIGGLVVRSVSVREPSVAASRIVTDANGSHVDLGTTVIDLSPQSAMLVSGDDARGVTVVLDRGSVECDVAPRAQRPPFVVQAGDVKVVVVGTHFTVSREGDAARVRVERGVVEVTLHGTRETVHAGEVWPRASHEPRAPSVVSDAPEESAASPPATLPGPLPAAPRRRVPSGTVRSSPQEIYDAALDLEARQPDAAMTLYRDLAKGDGAWAANALFAEGRLESDRGHGAESRRLLSEYLRRFPRGANAEDARTLLSRMP